ncbi:MAG: hypothetical protein IJY73_08545 [Oscillospiraceae bacterium]|nr:hypothetical protein [Oscillospiraceae bacterium]
MSKNKQILIFSGIGLLVLGGVTALLMLTAPEKEPEGTESEIVEEVIDERCYLTDKAMDDILSVNVVNSLGEYDIIKEDELWTIDGLQKAVISNETVESLVKNVTVMTASDYVE